MTALVVVEAACIILLGLLVVGLLRSHAEILRQLHDLGAGRDDELRPPSALPVASENGTTGSPAYDLAGETPGGEAAAVALIGANHDTLLAFLASGCLTCAGFWAALRAPGELGLPPNTRVIAVTKSPGDDSRSAIAELSPTVRTVVMSTQAWADYAVPGSPYFVHVSGARGRVVGEGTAVTWEQVVSLVSRAHEDRLDAGADGSNGGRDRRDQSRIDRDLRAAGIFPGHSDLYPGSSPIPREST